MTNQTLSEVIRRGVWHDNPGLIQLLGLCPLLAVSNTLVNGIGLGIATIGVLCATNVLVSACRHWLHPDFRLPIFVLIIATMVTATELLFKAYLFDLHLTLGIYLPLIVTNCVILGRAEAFASRQPILPALADGLGQGVGFALVLMTLGAFREILSQGSLLSGADMLFGPAGANLAIQVSENDSGLLLAALPPGAFIGLAVLIALRNLLSDRKSAKLTTEDPSPPVS